MDYFSRKSLSKYFKDTIYFNKHNINIFKNDTWRKYAGDSSKLPGDLHFAFDQRESDVNLHKVTSLPESSSNVSPEEVFKLNMNLVT